MGPMCFAFPSKGASESFGMSIFNNEPDVNPVSKLAECTEGQKLTAKKRLDELNDERLSN
ncbi:hypothetical protein EYZ11_012424 [Aspergillus tanneri]|uniref:Uncharacterized protein n=1 Tax=Aspergillus tanneri TaxID=1220188 RepID=A0A4S3J0A2_9EURO|nr:hypothetical protein EYZ11_012424 [Aspergillus tanneri]